MNDFDFLQFAKTQVQQDLLQAIDMFALPEPLNAAVKHAVLLGGKRVRPALVYAASRLGAQQHAAQQFVLLPAARRAAVAIELIHCYSLTHDDLPCMDNDALRRGQPTCHVVFGDAVAVLAGDVLQSMAFEVLTSRLFDVDEEPHADISLMQVQILATAASKMVLGQVLDLQAEGKSVSQTELENIHQHKTGALIQAAIMLGAIARLPQSDPAIAELRSFGQALGLAFQVQDDILDITGATEVLGKTAGKDIATQKSTYPALMGLQGAQAYAKALHEQALQHLDKMSYATHDLRFILSALFNRQS